MTATFNELNAIYILHNAEVIKSYDLETSLKKLKARIKTEDI